jgi:hypothetical protein
MSSGQTPQGGKQISHSLPRLRVPMTKSKRRVRLCGSRQLTRRLSFRTCITDPTDTAGAIGRLTGDIWRAGPAGLLSMQYDSYRPTPSRLGVFLVMGLVRDWQQSLTFWKTPG